MRGHQKMSVSTDVSITLEKPSPSADELPSRTRHAPRCNLSTANAVSPVTPPEQRSGNTYPHSTAISLLPCGRWPGSGGAVAEEFAGKVHFVDLGSLTDPRHVAGPSRRQIQGATKSGLWFGLFEL